MIAQALDAPEQADEVVDAIVVGRDIVIADRPVVAQSIARLPSEIIGAESEGDASPVVRASAEHARAPPRELVARRDDVRLAGDVPAADASVEFAERFRLRGLAAPRRRVRGHQHLRIACGVPRAPRLEERDLRAGVREHVRRHPAAGSRADDADIVRRVARAHGGQRVESASGRTQMSR